MSHTANRVPVGDRRAATDLASLRTSADCGRDFARPAGNDALGNGRSYAKPLLMVRGEVSRSQRCGFWGASAPSGRLAARVFELTPQSAFGGAGVIALDVLLTPVAARYRPATSKLRRDDAVLTDISHKTKGTTVIAGRSPVPTK